MTSTSRAAATGIEVHRAPVGRAPGSAPAGELRLTRRGRLVLLALILVVLLGAVLALGGYSAATDTRGAAPQTRTVVVGEGDTLWAIASRVAGPGDVREVVHELQELNALSGPELIEGQRIAVPTR